MFTTHSLVFSQRTLLALTQAGISRENAYRIVQRNAMKVWECNAETDFKTFLLEDEEVTKKLSSDELDKIFDYNAYLKNLDKIFERVF